MGPSWRAYGSSPCENCEQGGDLDGSSIREGVGFSDLANYWRNLGVKDSLASANISAIAAGRNEIK
jgi:hypothetical protein